MRIHTGKLNSQSRNHYRTKPKLPISPPPSKTLSMKDVTSSSAKPKKTRLFRSNRRKKGIFFNNYHSGLSLSANMTDEYKQIHTTSTIAQSLTWWWIGAALLVTELSYWACSECFIHHVTATSLRTSRKHWTALNAQSLQGTWQSEDALASVTHNQDSTRMQPSFQKKAPGQQIPHRVAES